MALTNRNAIELLIENMSSILLILSGRDRTLPPGAGLLRIVDLIKKSIDGVFRTVLATSQAHESPADIKRVLASCPVLPPPSAMSLSSLPPSSNVLPSLVTSVIRSANANFEVFRKYVASAVAATPTVTPQASSPVASTSVTPRGGAYCVATLEQALASGQLYVEKAYFLMVLESQIHLCSFIARAEELFESVLEVSRSSSSSLAIVDVPKALATTVRAYQALVALIRQRAQNPDTAAEARADMTAAAVAIQENLSAHLQAIQEDSDSERKAVECLREHVVAVVCIVQRTFAANCAFPGVFNVLPYPTLESERNAAKCLDTLIALAKTLYSEHSLASSALAEASTAAVAAVMNTPHPPRRKSVAAHLLKTLQEDLEKVTAATTAAESGCENSAEATEALGSMYLCAFALKKSVLGANGTLVCAYLSTLAAISVGSLRRGIEARSREKIDVAVPSFAAALRVVTGALRVCSNAHPDFGYKSAYKKALSALKETGAAIMALAANGGEATDCGDGSDPAKLFNEFMGALKCLSPSCYWIFAIADLVALDCRRLAEKISFGDDDNEDVRDDINYDECIKRDKVFLVDTTQKVAREVAFMKDLGNEILERSACDKPLAEDAGVLLGAANDVVAALVGTAMAYITSPGPGTVAEYTASLARVREFVKQAAFVFRPTTLSAPGSIVGLFKGDLFLRERLAAFGDCEVCRSIAYGDTREIVNFVRRLAAAGGADLTQDAAMRIKFSCFTMIAVDSPAATEQFVESLVANKVIASTSAPPIPLAVPVQSK